MHHITEGPFAFSEAQGVSDIDGDGVATAICCSFPGGCKMCQEGAQIAAFPLRQLSDCQFEGGRDDHD